MEEVLQSLETSRWRPGAMASNPHNLELLGVILLTMECCMPSPNISISIPSADYY